jgi:cell division topological specificity factor
MLDFLTKFFRREETSGSRAKERLRLVLMSDRVALAPDVFDSMKGEMLTVVRRYLDIDERGLDVHFENAERQFMLLANIPVLSIRPKPMNGDHKAATADRPRRRRRRRKAHPTTLPGADAAAHDDSPPSV